MRMECSTCNGKGRIIKEIEKCEKCKGDRMIKMTTNLEIHIEKGVPEGFVIKMNGEGDEGPNMLPGDINFVVTFEKHGVKNYIIIFIKKLI